jgi:hypothetical protein
VPSKLIRSWTRSSGLVWPVPSGLDRDWRSSTPAPSYDDGDDAGVACSVACRVHLSDPFSARETVARADEESSSWELSAGRHNEARRRRRVYTIMCAITTDQPSMHRRGG